VAENPLVHVPAAWPALLRANALRRQLSGKLRSFDLVRWPDVPYGDDVSQRLQLWELNDLAPRDGWPAVLLLHGGGWQAGSAQDFEGLAPALSRKGLYVAALDYRLAPAHRWPAQLDDVLAAIDFIKGLQIDPERIALWGHSAGGHLALLAAQARPDDVRCVVALGAPTDLRALSAEGALGLDLVFDPGQLDAASPLRAEAAGAPTLLVHGALDRVVPISSARAYQARHPEEVELLEVPDGDHGLRWPPWRAMRARAQAVDWMIAQLSPERRKSKWKIRRKHKKP
jgi:acetyl esterase/lipase